MAQPKLKMAQEVAWNKLKMAQPKLKLAQVAWNKLKMAQPKLKLAQGVRRATLDKVAQSQLTTFHGTNLRWLKQNLSWLAVSLT